MLRTNPHVVIGHTGHEPSENGGDATDTEGGAGSDEPMAEWGVGSDDEAWGDDGDDGEEDETVNNGRARR
jgi:hypothetical protein